MPKIAVVTGNPKPASRTRSVALAVAAVLTRELPQADTDPVIDLAGYAPRLFDRRRGQGRGRWSGPAIALIVASRRG